MKSFEYKILIKEHHLDGLGHVNNAIYMFLYEEARWDFITQNGFGLEEILTRQQGPVILDVSMRYKKEIKNRETITIISHCQEDKGKIMKVQQHMQNEAGVICNQALFTIGFMDLSARKLVMPPIEWRRAIGNETID